MIFSGGPFLSSAMLRFQSMNTLFLIHNSFRLVAAFFVLFFWNAGSPFRVLYHDDCQLKRKYLMRGKNPVDCPG